MSHVKNESRMARASVLMGAAIVVLTGLTASVQAFPAAARPAAPDLVRTIQYDGDEMDLAVGPYGENDHLDHPGTAGLYDCGPGGKNTRLSRKACGGIDRFQHLGQGF